MCAETYILGMKKQHPKYITAKEWGSRLEPRVSIRRVHQMYEDGKIPGAIKPQRDILIPDGAPDPRQRDSTGKVRRGRPELSAKNIQRIK